MNKIIYIDRISKKRELETIYCEKTLCFFYNEWRYGDFIRRWLLWLMARWPFVSRLYGSLQKLKYSRRKIKPFIKQFCIDESEFLYPVASFQSFNDFFVRKLKKEARPISKSEAIIPADGKYLFYQDMSVCESFTVKGVAFDLPKLLGSQELAHEFKEGSMVIGRLCPSDYHRFHFPCDCTAEPAYLINGHYFSVNPLTMKKNRCCFLENKRMVTILRSPFFGKILFLEIGATNVGSIRETYRPGEEQLKGDEKGYFELGASALILLFSKDSIIFDPDLIEATRKGYEIRCLLGQSMGNQIH